MTNNNFDHVTENEKPKYSVLKSIGVFFLAVFLATITVLLINI